MNHTDTSRNLTLEGTGMESELRLFHSNRRAFLISLLVSAHYAEMKRAMGSPMEADEQAKAEKAVEILVKHFDAAYASGKLIVEASSEDRAEQHLSEERDAVLLGLCRDLRDNGMDFQESSEGIATLAALLRRQGYLLLEGDLLLDLPVNKAASLRIYHVILAKIHRMETEALSQYLPEHLKVGPDAKVEVLFVGNNLITEGEKAIGKSGCTVRMLGTTERRLGGAAVLFEDAIEREMRSRLEKRGMKGSKAFAEERELLTHDTKINEIFHVIFQSIFHEYFEKPPYHAARLSLHGKSYRAVDVDEAFSNLGSILYGKGPFIGRLNETLANKTSRTYALSQVLFFEAAEAVCRDLGIPISEEKKFHLSPEEVEEFETKFKKVITREIIGLIGSLLKALNDAESKKEKH